MEVQANSTSSARNPPASNSESKDDGPSGAQTGEQAEAANEYPNLHNDILTDGIITLKARLDQIRQDSQLANILSMKNEQHRNALSTAIRCKRLEIVQYIYTRLSGDSIYKLLLEPDKYGDPAILWASERDHPLDEILSPKFTTLQSQNAVCRYGTLRRKSNQAEIDLWFKFMPNAKLIEMIVKTIYKGTENVTELRLHSRLSSHQIQEVLKARRYGQTSETIIHRLVRSNGASLVRSLLNEISEEAPLMELLKLKNQSGGRNVLSRALAVGGDWHDIVRYICGRLDSGNLYQLLCEPGKESDWTGSNYPLDQLLSAEYTTKQCQEIVCRYGCLRRNAKEEEIDLLFKYMPSGRLLDMIANAIDEWRTDDIAKLDLHSRLSPEQFVDCLKRMPSDVFKGLGRIDRLINYGPYQLVELLLSNISEEARLMEVLKIKNQIEERNVLRCALFYGRYDLVRYIYSRLDSDKLHQLICEPDKEDYQTRYGISKYPFDQTLSAEFTVEQCQEIACCYGPLRITANQKEIDLWFKFMPVHRLIEMIAVTIETWWWEGDITKLCLHSRLSSRQVVELLKPPMGRSPIEKDGKSVWQYLTETNYRCRIVYDIEPFNEFKLMKKNWTSLRDTFINTCELLTGEDLCQLLHLVKTRNGLNIMIGDNKDEDPLRSTASTRDLPDKELSNRAQLENEDPRLEWNSMDILRPEPSNQDHGMNPTECLLRLLTVMDNYSSLLKILTVNDAGQRNLLHWARNELGTELARNRARIGHGMNPTECLLRLFTVMDDHSRILKILTVNDADQRCLLHWARNKLRTELAQNRARIGHGMNPTECLLRLLTVMDDHSSLLKVLTVNDVGQRNLLHWAARNGWLQFLDIMKKFLSHEAYLDIASRRDSNGNTAFHYAATSKSSDIIQELIKDTLCSQTRKQFVEVLSWKNHNGSLMADSGVNGAHKDNMVIYKWALESAQHRRYLMFDYPSVLIISNTKNRPGAEQEAQKLVDCLREFGFLVIIERDLSASETLKAIETAAKSAQSSNGIIVAMMSHGREGYILDNTGMLIAIEDIERNMCQGCHRESPKLLILQCCQNRDSSQYSRGDIRDAAPDVAGAPSDDNLDAERSATQNQPIHVHVHKSYCPSSSDFCAIMSTGPDRISYRGLMIKHLTTSLREMHEDEDISAVMLSVREKIKNELAAEEYKDGIQVPVEQHTMNSRYALKQVLPIVLLRKDLEAFQAEEERRFGRRQKLE